MKPTVYIETTIVSYLTAWPSRDLIRAAQQRITLDWWKSEKDRFDVLTSELVILESSAGDAEAARVRLEVLSKLRLAEANDDAEKLASELLTTGAVPAVAARDALHVGIAAANGIDYLLTWNCRHLANAALRSKIDQVCGGVGFRAPIIATPEELFESK
jgi:hypothetical protein